MQPPEPPSVFRRAAEGEFAGSVTPLTDAPVAAFAPVGEGGDLPQHAWQPPLAGSETWERIGISRLGSDRPAITLPQRSDAVPARAASGLPALRIIGQLAASYIIAEGPEGLYLIDQHASHERVMYEKLLAQHELGAVQSQALLDPLPVEVPLDAAALLEERMGWLRDVGFDIDFFGGNTFLVRAVPQMVPNHCALRSSEKFCVAYANACRLRLGAC
ncbi:MAG: hypothetical protein NTZ50_13575 [Chloroflexi bacterium]|nr:hypothetical protein [Chloroflexota bacterium]